MKCQLTRARAIDDNEKAVRKRSILNAAKELYMENTEQLPSVIKIAQTAGLAKGTVYLYFKTKEEIFLDLLAELYEELLTRVQSLIEQDTDSSVLMKDFIDELLAFIESHPHFMPLASIGNTVLEKNSDEKSIVAFKRMLVDQLVAIGKQLHNRFPSISEDNGATLLIHTHALMIGLWQMQNWPPHLRELLEGKQLGLILPDFSQELAASVQTLWVGALAQQQ